MHRLNLLIVSLLYFVQIASGQNTAPQLIGVDYKQAKIEQVANDLANKTGYRFYYDAAVFGSLSVTLQANRQTLEYILDAAFKNTAFRYAITDQHEVFLTKSMAIQTELAEGIFEDKPISNKPAPPAILSFDTEEKIVPVATIENKIYEIGIKTNNIGAGKATIAGYVKDIKSGEPVIGASLYSPDTKMGVVTDKFGYYSLTLPKGQHTIEIRSISNKDTRRQFILYADGRLNIELQEQIVTLKQVKISADKVANVKSVELGANLLDIKSIKDIPAVFGETDILRAIQLLPGIQSVGEATTGFNVRGGAADQNLIMLNGSTIYNPAHFFGFFSAFNPDIVKDVELYKSSIPEKYGGRLSSVLDVTDREGNKKIFTGSAGIGLLTSRLSVEGPIVKDRTSFIFGGRITYSDWLLNLLPPAYKNSSASFYDFNLDISHQINEKNNLYIYSYISNDNFRLNSDTTYSYSNKNIAVKWKHNFNNKLYSVISGGFDRYQYQTEGFGNPVDAYKLNFNINQTNFKADFNYYASNRHTLTFGVSSIYYKINPGTYDAVGIQSLVRNQTVPSQQALESALYVGDKYDISDKFSISAGIRFSIYNSLGPATVNTYAPGLPKQAANVTDSVHYGNNKIIKTYTGPEIRVSARYIIGDDLSVKAGYNTLRQYIHLLSNSTAISPSDVYQLSDPNIKPQYGDQVSLGLYKNLKSNTIETSVEVYYKRIKDYLDYKSGATILLNDHVETDVINTEGKAYGIELLAKKTTGLLTGLMSYTYSRTFLRQNDPTVVPLVNNGAYYPANYDKPHDFNFTGAYHFTHRYSFSLNLVYSTGRPITLPLGKYVYAAAERVYYSDRNQYRVPDYFRSDIAFNIEGNHKIRQLTHNSWTVGIYNISGRQNAYSTYFSEQNGRISGYKLSIFASAIPFVNYNIKF